MKVAESLQSQPQCFETCRRQFPRPAPSRTKTGPRTALRTASRRSQCFGEPRDDHFDVLFLAKAFEKNAVAERDLSRPAFGVGARVRHSPSGFRGLMRVGREHDQTWIGSTCQADDRLGHIVRSAVYQKRPRQQDARTVRRSRGASLLGPWPADGGRDGGGRERRDSRAAQGHLWLDHLQAAASSHPQGQASEGCQGGRAPARLRPKREQNVPLCGWVESNRVRRLPEKDNKINSRQWRWWAGWDSNP